MCIGSYADISVHAPTRGATSNSLSFSIFSVFQSTLPREERLLGLNFKEANSIFQSTLPREERLLQQYLSHFQLLFQSTLPREERLAISPNVVSTTFYFNPRSHERSDTTCDRLARGSYDFNPRSHERSDTTCDRLARGSYDFNPRSHERSDEGDSRQSCYKEISIHAPTRGATAILHKKFVYFYTIPTINI